MHRVNLLRGHGSPTQYHYVKNRCRCALCRAALSDYRKRRYQETREESRAYQKQYYYDNLDKVRANARKYAAEHYDERRDYVKQYRVDAAEKIAERQRQYKTEHADELREYRKQYRATHRVERATWERARNARKREVCGTHTAEDVRAQYQRQRGKCYWRNVNPECAVNLKDGYHVDHVVPLASERQSSNGAENIVLSCPICNMQKHTADPMDWAGQLF